jgi:hypothetical protein
VRKSPGFLLLFALIRAAAAQTVLQPIPRFPIRPDPLTIRQAVNPAKPFTVAGERGALLGRQNGTFEAWQYPVKLFSRFSITAELADYPVPIDVTAHAAAIEIAPAMTTIVYSHAAFTVKQRMFATRTAKSPAAVVVLFEIASVRPMHLTFRCKPEMQRMWPAPNFGTPNAEWVEKGGYYVLHTDNPEFSAAMAMPRAQPGILPPYQERPAVHPLEFRLSFDPRADSDLFFPLLVSLGPPAGLDQIEQNLAALYRETEDYYAHFFDTRLTAETPDPMFDRALRWAAIAVDQGRVRFHDETGLVAGYYESGDSARPGYAWFFGRDALWTSYAINSYGDFGLTRQALEFLIRRQRADGKIMHEFSQTADLVDWKSTPYFYAAADSTPLLVMAMEDYVNVSGDLEFLRTHWDAVSRAYDFTRAHDSDRDGIYENTEGTGWVESWPSGMPHQEIYLAALDQQCAASMARLAALFQGQELAAEAAAAKAQAEAIRGRLQSEYYDPEAHFYAFSRNRDGPLDRTATIYPAVAWWTGRLTLPRADDMFSRWASSEFSTDWGTRDISGRTPFYDPISYHQGSVWPLFTGWVALAEYRAGRTLSGYAHLMQNAALTFADDPGGVTELLSGEFFQPLGRSSSRQVWSSAMVLSPALRGLFGLEWDALRHTLALAPNLPAAWDRARLHNVPLGNARIDLEFTREGDRLRVRGRSASQFCLVAQAGPADASCRDELLLPLPAVEVGMPSELPLPGSVTGQVKTVGESRVAANHLEVDFEAPAGSEWQLPLRLNRPKVQVAGAEIAGGKLRLRFPSGAGFQRRSVTFTW